MKKLLIRLKKLPKFQWLAISVLVATFFTYYGVTSYINSGNEEPRWMVCNPKKDDRKPLYLMFHNTNKYEWNYKKRKWVKSINKYSREVMPTIEMYEDKSFFEETSYILYYENEWIRNKFRKRKYDDEEIDKLFKEVEKFVSPYEDILLSNGKTLTASRSLDLFQCKEVSSIKPKI